MLINYGIEYRIFSFIVLHDRRELFVSQIKLSGILAPFPVWVWFAIGQIGFKISTFDMQNETLQIHNIDIVTAILACL